MSSTGQEEDAAVAAGLTHTGTPAPVGAMSKLPARPGATKQQTPASSQPNTEPIGNASGASAAAAAPQLGDAGGSASASGSAPITAQQSGRNTIPPRTSGGPSLPPRTARSSGTAAKGGSSSNATATASTTATSTAATAVPAGPSPTGANGTSGAASGAVPAAPASALGSSGSGGGASASPATGSGSGGGAGPGRKAPSGGLSALPPRGGLLLLPVQGPVLDPDEPEAVAEVRRSIHAVRVQMISSALRLGYDHENALVKQVLYRLALAERLKAPWRRPGKRPDPVVAAAREAARRTEEARGGPDSPPLGFTVKIMLIGLQGSGKTQLAHSLIGPTGQPAVAVHPFEGATRRVTLLRGSAHGIGLVFVDTPGLSLAPGGAARNCQVLQQIRRAYQTHRPDLLVYVDRLDAPTPAAGPGAGPGGAGAELAVLRGLTTTLGPALWLNTIVAFTHAGSSPPGGSRTHSAAPSFESWLEVRSHALQQVIRQASGDERLMNPVAFAESHPACPTNSAGQPVIYNGMPWRSHLLLMVTSAKLLADTEALLQMQGGGGGGGAPSGPGAAAGANSAALRQMMGGAKQVPLSYIMQQVTQVSRPLKFPDHRNVMDVRRARHDAAGLPQPRMRREAGRQVALRVLALRQAARKQRAMADAYRRGTASGCKVTPEPPRVATRCRPSALPAEGFRYRAPEAQGGWVVRPNVEQHCADVSDGVEGFVLNKVAVAAPRRPGEDDGLLGYGVPYHHYVSAQFTKDQRLLAARSEGTVYHDPVGSVTTSLSADLQTSATAGGLTGGDVLMVLRSDTRLRGPRGGRWPKVTLGTVAARVGEEGRLPLGLGMPVPLRGPTALGLRVQATKKTRLGAAATPLRVSAAAAALQRASELAAGRMGMGLGRGGGGGGGDAACLGASAELGLDLADVLDLPLPRSLPGTLGANLMRSPEGDITAFLSANVQYRLGAREMLAVRANWDKRGRAGVSLRLKTVSGWWAGLVAMTLPLGRLAADAAVDAWRRLRALRRRLRQQQQQQEQKEQQQKAAAAAAAAAAGGARSRSASGKAGARKARV